MALYYWVGGNGTWDNANTANWSNASGGSSGFGPPTSGDDVIFNSASGTGTCTTAATAACNNCTLNSSTLGITLGANTTFAFTFTLTLGAINLNNYNLYVAKVDLNNSNVRSIAFGTGGLYLSTTGSIWLGGTLTNFTYTGTPNVYLTNSSASARTLDHGSTAGGSETNAVSFYVTAGTGTLSLSNSTATAYKTLDFTGFAGSLSNTYFRIYGDLIISSGMTVTAGGNAPLFCGTGTQKITTNGKTIDCPIIFGYQGVGGTFQLQDNLTVGSTRSVTLTNGTLDLNSKTLSTGIFSSSNSNTRSIAFGTGNITLTGNAATVWTTSTATNFSYTGTPTVNSTYAGSTGTRTFNTGNTEANSVSFNISAGADTVVIGAAAKNIDFTGFSGTLGTSARTVYGNLTISSGMTVSSSTSVTTFGATSGTQQITTNGKTIDFPMTFNGIGGTFAFQDALTLGSTRAFTLTNGTVQLKAGATTTVGSFATSGTNQKYLQSTLAGSQATLSDASGTNSLSYTTIKDINATGGATWNAYLTSNNVNSGNNTGFDWYYEPGEYMYTRRKTKRLLIQ